MGFFSSSQTKTTMPVQTQQSGQAFGGATGAAGTLGSMGGQYGQNALNMYNSLFGNSGSLKGMMDPKSLNVSSPTGPFALAYSNDKTALANQAANNARNIRSRAGEMGFGGTSPSAFTASELNANDQNLANGVGGAFSTETGNSYDAALNNFWNATNLAASAANQQGNLGENSTDAAGRLYQSLYAPSLGSTEKTTSNPSVMSDIGTLGSAGLQLGTALFPGSQVLSRMGKAMAVGGKG